GGRNREEGPPQPKIHGQLGRDFPIVLEIRGKLRVPEIAVGIRPQRHKDVYQRDPGQELLQAREVPQRAVKERHERIALKPGYIGAKSHRVSSVCPGQVVALGITVLGCVEWELETAAKTSKRSDLHDAVGTSGIGCTTEKRE